VVRTQHHWYLDPLYPALAMAAAGCALFLVERTPDRRRALAIAALVALPLALCEARVLGRVLIREPMSAAERFLAGFTPASTGGCREIRTTWRLAWSERFILEVADGFDVVEPGQAVPATASAPAPANTACLLVGKRPWRRPPAAARAASVPGPPAGRKRRLRALSRRRRRRRRRFRRPPVSRARLASAAEPR